MSDHTDSSMIDPRDTIAVEAQRAIERARGWVQRWVSAGKAPAPAVERALADLLTEAEQQGHERGVREERERAVEKCDALAREQQATAGRMDEAGWAEAAALCIRSADTARLLACTIASGTPGDTEGADPTTEGGEDE